MCVGCTPSPESLTDVNSSGFIRLPPSCNSNYLEYIFVILQPHVCWLLSLLGPSMGFASASRIQICSRPICILFSAKSNISFGYATATKYRPVIANSALF
ncbi:hypothetical protein CS536_00170 [Yersinia kristensenii]|nr:hypothetical protein CS536_00170 [Yersinia kristensenii]